MWPAVDTGEEYVDPLRDRRIVEVLRKQGMDHCCVTPWLFGQEGNGKHKLIAPCGITINSNGQFIIADNGDKNMKVLDGRGQCIDHFSLHGNVDQDVVTWLDVASDMNDIYLLVKLSKPSFRGYKSNDYFVYKVNDTGELLHKFSVDVIGDLSLSLNLFFNQYGLRVDNKGKVMFRSDIYDVICV